MGILAANIVGFGQPMLAYAWPGGFLNPQEAWDNWLWLGQFVLIDGKMRGLFTLLFGAGLVLFMDHADARGDSGNLQVRRLAVLLLFGLAHYYLLWRGDILVLYAACGAVALLGLRWRPETQLATGLIGYLAGAAFNSLWSGLFWSASSITGSPAGRALQAVLADQRADGIAERAIARRGSYADYVAHAATTHGSEWALTIMHVWVETLPLMLIGMALYRFGLFDGRCDRHRQARYGWAGIAIGSTATLALGGWVESYGLSYSGTLFAFLGPTALLRLPVVLGLAAVLAQVGARAHGWLGARIVAAGRMAFSNYIGTSLAMLLVFQPPGLRMFGEMTRIELYGVVVATWMVMLVWSKWWLAQFNYGPLEWLWRCATYGRWFPFFRY